MHFRSVARKLTFTEMPSNEDIFVTRSKRSKSLLFIVIAAAPMHRTDIEPSDRDRSSLITLRWGHKKGPEFSSLTRTKPNAISQDHKKREDFNFLL